MSEEIIASYEKGTSSAFSLKDWTTEDKYKLWTALKTYDSRNVEEISKVIGTKTPDEVKAGLREYKRQVMKHPSIVKRKRRDKIEIKYLNKVPLTNWAKYLSDNIPFQKLKTETAAALRIIAKFEDIPNLNYTEKIDFRKVYHLIANALDGKDLPDDKTLAEVINYCLVETALVSQIFVKKRKLNNLFQTIALMKDSRSYFPKPTDSSELRTLEKLIAQQRYNPLSIQIEELDPTLDLPKY